MAIDTKVGTQRRSVEKSYLATIRDIVSLVNATTDIATIIQNIVDAVCRYTNWDRSVIIAAEPASGHSIIIVESLKQGLAPFDVSRVWELATSPILQVIETRGPLVVPDTSVSEFPAYSDPRFASRFKTIAFLPLNCHDGEGRDLVLSVHSAAPVDVAQDELELLQTICHLAAIAVNRAQLIRKERLQSQRLSRSAAAGSGLMSAALEATPPATMLARLESVLSAPIAVANFSEGSVWVTRSPFQDCSDDEWQKLVEDDDVFQQFFEMTTAHASAGLKRILWNFETPLPVKTIAIDLHPIRLDGILVGSMIVFHSEEELGAVESEIEKVNTQQALTALSSYLLRSHLALKNQMLENSRFFARLFEGNVKDSGRIPYIAKQAGIEWGLPSRILAIGGGSSEGHFPNPDEVLRYLIRAMSESNTPGSAVEIEGNVIVHLRAPVANQKTINSLVARIDRLLRLGGDRSPVVAVSDPIESIATYGDIYQQCVRTVALAQKSGRTGMVSMADFGPFSLLLNELNGNTIDAFVARTLGDIIEHDTQKSSDYLETISALTAASFQLPDAARALHIHVSTLRYRLSRLEQLFTIDLSDEDTRLSLALAVRIHGANNAGSGIGTKSGNVGNKNSNRRKSDDREND